MRRSGVQIPSAPPPPAEASLTDPRDACRPSMPVRMPILVHDHPARFGEQTTVFHQAGEHFVATWNRAPANPEGVPEAGVSLTLRLGFGWRPHHQSGQTDSR